MKLYTEEQVKQCLDDYFSFRDGAIYYALSKMTPIELPSDEEIEESETDSPHDGIDEYNYGFIDGANWVKEFILNQNK